MDTVPFANARYEVLQRLGAGGQGEVWVARDPRRGELVTLRRTDTRTPGLEGAASALRIGLRHPCLAALLDVVRAADGIWTVEEYVLGRDAPADRSPAALLRSGRLLLHALATLHARGLAHFDIKPANLVWTPGPGAELPVLIDFGLARPVDATTRAAGTLGTAAPELFSGPAHPERVDLFGLGCTLLAFALGEGPDPRWSLRPDSLLPLLAGLPAALQPPLRGLLSTDPRDRFDNSAAALEAWPDAQGPLWTPPERWPLVGREVISTTVHTQLDSGSVVMTITGAPGSGRARLARELAAAAELRAAHAGRTLETHTLLDLHVIDDVARSRVSRVHEGAVVIVTTEHEAVVAGVRALAGDAPVLHVDCAPLDAAAIAALRAYVPLPPDESSETLATRSGGRPAELARLLLPPDEEVLDDSIARLAAHAFAPLPIAALAGAETAIARGHVLPRPDGTLHPRSPAEAERLRAATAPAQRTALHAQLAQLLAEMPDARLHALLAGAEDALPDALLLLSDWIAAERYDAAMQAASQLLATVSAPALRTQDARLADLLRRLVQASRLDDFDALLGRVADEEAPALLAVHAYVASEAGRPDEAITRAQRALTADPALGFDTWLDLARAQQWRSDWAGAARTLETARAHAHDAAQRADWGRLMGLVLFRLGRTDEGIARTEEALCHAHGAVRLGLLQNLAMMRRHRGEAAQAAELFTAAGEGFIALGDLRNAAIVWINSGIALQDSGQLRRSQELRERALRTARSAGLAQIRDVALAGLGIVAATRGAWTRADAWLAEAEAALRAQGMQREARLARLHRAACRLRVRENAEELAALQEEFGKLRAAGHLAELALCWRILLEHGAEARLPWPLARRVLLAADRPTHDALRIQLHRWRAGIDADRGARSLDTLRALAERRGPSAYAAAFALLALERDPVRRRRALAFALKAVRGSEALGERIHCLAEACSVSRHPAAHAGRLLRACAELETLQRGDEEDELYRSLQETLKELRACATEFGQNADARATPASAVPLLGPLLEVHRVLSDAETDEETALRVVLEQALHIAAACRGFMVLRDDEGRERFACSLIRTDGAVRAAGFEFSRSLLDEVLDGGKARVTVNALEDPEWRFARSVVDFELASIACVPIVGEGQVLGAIYLDNPFATGRFREDVLPVLEAFATQVALATLALRRQRRIATLNLELEGSLAEARSRLEDAQRELAEARPRRPILYCSAAMERVMREIRRFAATDLPVHVRGETGTGKELVARKLHELSARRDGPFVSENCSAIATEILESELFGHVQGAFTGAVRDKPGLVRQAHGGTLFLDEIGDMPLALQAKLLRVLQEGEVRPVGGDRAMRVDVRLVTATHRDLAEMVAAGDFREDLYYRVVVARIELPPLRERREDIALLAKHFVQQHGHAGLELSSAALDALCELDWPGNVRQLESAVRSAVVMCNGTTIEPEHLRLAALPARERSAPGDFPLDLRELEKLALARALEQSGGNRAEAAKLLGISRSSVFVKIREYGLSDDS